VLTYSDNVLYNWRLDSGDPDELPTIPALKCLTSFTSTGDEAEFYLVPARMELAGVEALELMRSTMDEMFVGDALAVRRITTYLDRLVDTIHRLRGLLLDVRRGCDPNVFYRDVRPWLRGEDSQAGRKWEFDGLEEDTSLAPPNELSGPSAGQSSLIHALDIFLGVDKSTHGQGVTGHGLTSTDAQQQHRQPFLQRMQMYMPRYHRAFLVHLSRSPRQLRTFVTMVVSSSSSSSANGAGESSERPPDGAALLRAYNAAVGALKELRDAHLIIVALYIIGPSRHRPLREGDVQVESGAALRGTGGTDLVRFLKEVRDRTEEAVFHFENS
jgi:indoleamine 2,3-dioxygenase